MSKSDSLVQLLSYICSKHNFLHHWARTFHAPRTALVDKVRNWVRKPWKPAKPLYWYFESKRDTRSYLPFLLNELLSVIRSLHNELILSKQYAYEGLCTCTRIGRSWRSWCCRCTFGLSCFANALSVRWCQFSPRCRCSLFYALNSNRRSDISSTRGLPPWFGCYYYFILTAISTEYSIIEI